MKYNQLGATEDGRQWALCALHPCGEMKTDPVGIPDNTQAAVVTPAYRGSNVIGPAIDAITTTWDCQVLFPPFAEIDFIYRVRAAGSDDWANPWHIVRNPGFDLSPDGSAKTLGDNYRVLRMQGRGYTVHLRASATTNQGTVYAGQVSANKASNFTPEGVTLVPDQRGFATTDVDILDVPSSSTILTQQDVLFTKWEAMHGVYMPMRFSQPTHLFVDTDHGDVFQFTNGEEPPVLYQYPSAVLGIVSSPTNAFLFDTIANGVTPTFNSPPGAPHETQVSWGVSKPLNQLTGVLFFEGLDPAASLEFKSKMFLECQADQRGAAVLPFVHSSPISDCSALEVVAQVGQVQRHAYEAAYNDFGSMLSSIWNAISGLARPIVKPFVEMASDIPLIGGLAKPLASKLKLYE